MNDVTMKKFINASITPVTAIDFIKTIKKTADFALKNFTAEDNQ